MPRISHRDPHLQLSGLASGYQANTQPGTTSRQLLHPGRALAAVDSGLPVSAESGHRHAVACTGCRRFSPRSPAAAAAAGAGGGVAAKGAAAAGGAIS
jgi:hypothetical protein